MTDDDMSRDLRQRLRTLAATCFSTYDVCVDHVPSILSSADDVAVAVHCAGIIFDNTPGSSFVEHGDLGRLLNRHHRLLHFLEPFFREAVCSDPTGIDQGLTHLWPGFRRQASSNWQVFPNPNSRWIACTVDSGQGVHYNLLTGQLLVGGKPRGKLPREIINHPTYVKVLGAVSVPIIFLTLIHTYALFSGILTWFLRTSRGWNL